MYLFDTNLLSELRRPDRVDSRVLDWAREVPNAIVYVSAVSIFEIERGVRLVERRDPAQATLLLRWLELGVLANYTDRILPVDEPVARAAAALHVPDPRPIADAFLAATAIVHGLTLATRNVRDFVGTGAALYNPWDGAG